MKQIIVLATALLAFVVSGPVLAGQAQGQSATATQHATSSNRGVQLVNTFEAPESQDSLKTVPDVSAPVINAAPETCGIPVAGGVAWLGFGVTGGTAYTDQECVDRLNARQFVQTGLALGGHKTDAGRRVIVASVELMCEGKKQKALARAGIICGEQEEEDEEVEAERLTEKTLDRDDAFAFQVYE